MNQHFGEVRNLVNKGETSDFFAKNFASHLPKRRKIFTKNVRDKVKMENPLEVKPNFLL